MRKTICISVSLVAALAACGKSGSHGNGSQSAAGDPAAAASDIQIQPGEWEVTYETTDVSGAGLPPSYVAMMKGHKTTRRDCITPEQAAQPMKKMMEAQQKGECDYKGFSIADGHIQGTVTCGGGKIPTKMTMTMNGQYDAQSYTYTSSMTSEGQGMNMTIQSRSVAHRVGECPAGGKDDEK